MKHRRHALAAIVGISVFGAAAAAKEEWKTVTLGGNPGLTISIPAAAENQISGTDPDNLMYFAVSAGFHGSLECMAQRSEYPQGAARSAFAAALATERRNLFCKQDDAAISDLDIGTSDSFVHNGSQAAVCTASYTQSAKELPGRVRSQMIIAAPDKIYFLTCTIKDEEQELAEYEWARFWEEKVRHIQNSFHLPK